MRVTPLARRFAFLTLAFASGWLFFRALPTLWPLVPVSSTVPHAVAERRARAFLTSVGVDVNKFDASVTFEFAGPVIDYVDRLFGKDTARALTRRTSMVLQHVSFRRSGEPTIVSAEVHPDGKVVGWYRSREDDDAGGPGDSTQANRMALSALAMTEPFTVAPAWSIIGSSTRRRDRRTDRTITFERQLEPRPLLLERATVVVAGDQVSSLWRRVVVPDAAERAERVREGPRVALGAAGLLLLALAVIGGFITLLRSLSDGSARIAEPAKIAVVIATGALATLLLDERWIIAYWDPLVPKWISGLNVLADRAVNGTWGILVLFIVIAAGDAIDRKGGSNRGTSLWLMLRGRFTHPAVGRASLNGFLVGLLCGGALAATVSALVHFGHATVSLQPRGFFVKVLDSRYPVVTSLMFFGSVALVEELGYRFFAGTWLEQFSGRKWIAIVVPAVVYGLTHTSLSFLPPADPFWARPLALTIVGAIWGWAFFRFDALTVVLSHLTSDLFVFNWPRLASPDHFVQAAALGTVLIPLIPAVLAFGRSMQHRAAYSLEGSDSMLPVNEFDGPPRRHYRQ